MLDCDKDYERRHKTTDYAQPDARVEYRVIDYCQHNCRAERRAERSPKHRARFELGRFSGLVIAYPFGFPYLVFLLVESTRRPSEHRH